MYGITLPLIWFSFDACNSSFDLILLSYSLIYRTGAVPFSRLRLYRGTTLEGTLDSATSVVL
jgi:hypothetical protein